MVRGPGLARTNRELLKARRHELGLTQRQLAETAHIGRAEIGNVEAGHQRALSLGATKLVAGVLGLSMEALTVLPDEENGHPPVLHTAAGAA